MNNIYIKIDSSNRDTGSSSSSYTINLTDPLSTGTYKLHYFHMPLSIYNVTSNNNKIYFYENSANRTGTITPGIYSSLDITTAVKSAMDAASTGAYNVFTISLDSNTQKITYSASNNFHFTYLGYKYNFFFPKNTRF